MFVHKKMKVGKSTVEAFLVTLLSKKLILLKAKNGYVMCGYIDLRVAEKFGDAAVKITGVSTVRGAVNSTVVGCTSRARQLGVRKGQPVKDALEALS